MYIIIVYILFIYNGLNTQTTCSQQLLNYYITFGLNSTNITIQPVIIFTSSIIMGLPAVTATFNARNAMLYYEQQLISQGITFAPTLQPTNEPTGPTNEPTNAPTRAPTRSPTTAPTRAPTRSPTTAPTRSPTRSPTRAPTRAPTRSPTAPIFPINQPTTDIPTT